MSDGVEAGSILGVARVAKGRRSSVRSPLLDNERSLGDVGAEGELLEGFAGSGLKPLYTSHRRPSP